jgi:hypothetical protein
MPRRVTIFIAAAIGLCALGAGVFLLTPLVSYYPSVLHRKQGCAFADSAVAAVGAGDTAWLRAASYQSRGAADITEYDSLGALLRERNLVGASYVAFQRVPEHNLQAAIMRLSFSRAALRRVDRRDLTGEADGVRSWRHAAPWREYALVIVYHQERWMLYGGAPIDETTGTGFADSPPGTQ